MELGLSNTLLAGDPRLVDIIVGEVKSQGIFDQFRKECIADVDTKPAYQNLRTRVEGSVNTFLDKQLWKPDLNKNQLRETLRKHIHEAPYLDAGVERIVDQVVNPKVYSVFMPQIEDVVYKFLGIERPKTKEKNGACGLKDLLPKDLDPVSPESDKNSLKDVSLESVDGTDEVEAKKEEKLSMEQKAEEEEASNEKPKDINLENGRVSSEEKVLDENGKASNRAGSNTNLNVSVKSDDKTEEDEEDSPTFEPIDIMNLNESNISNDSHLSGISELTSHRSRSPDFCTELSRDNFDYSNQDSQLSKVSSDSRLSIVTDMGSSNHASTPVQEKDEAKNGKDNFKAVRDFEACKNKAAKNVEPKPKDTVAQESKDSKNSRSSLSSKENSRDATDNSVKEKYEHKAGKEKSKESESSRSKSRDKNPMKDSKHHRDRSADKKKQKTHSSSKYDKHEKSKTKEKTDQTRENSENSKDNANKPRDEKAKDSEEKLDTSSKEAKDLKDLYKEKIRELREKKELTEKEKLNRDNKDTKTNKEIRERKDSPKDKKPYKKEHKSSSGKGSSASDGKTAVKSSEKLTDGKERRSSDSREKVKRDEKSRVSKDSKLKNHVSAKSENEKSEKQEIKRVSKGEKEEKSEKSEAKKEARSSSEKGNGKKETKNHSQSKSSSKSLDGKLEGKRDSKNDVQYKEKKRREEKKSKSKDDHSSLRKSSNDRRSTDRDGSNGSSGKSSQPSNLSSGITNNKSGSSTLSKESSSQISSNSSSEISDNVEEAHSSEVRSTSDQDQSSQPTMEVEVKPLDTEFYEKPDESDANETNLPLKKRPLVSEDENAGTSAEIKVKKPKFAKNFQEAKKLMKIRKQIERQKLRESKKLEKKLHHQKVEQTVVQPAKPDDPDNLASVPDEERVQIIEIPDEEYEEPYPEKQTNLSLAERSIILLGGEPCAKDLLQTPSYSDMELCIGRSVAEPINEPEKTEKPTVETAATADEPDSKPEDPTTSSESETKERMTEIVEPSSAVEDSAQQPAPVEQEEARATTSASQESEPEQSSGKQEVQAETVLPSDLRVEENVPPNDPKPVEDVNEAGSRDTRTEEEEPAMNDAKTDQEQEDEKVKDEDEEMKEEEPRRIDETSPETSFAGDPPNPPNPPDPPNPPSDTSVEKDVSVGEIEKEASTECASVSLAEPVATTSSAEDECRYFTEDNERSAKFSSFLESLELTENATLEDMIECLGGRLVTAAPQPMAPPLPKRKHSSSPLTDLLISNSNNNNDGHKKSTDLAPSEDALTSIKKRKLVGTKKQRFHANVAAPPQGLLNGENFVMPLSPESDVSATSEKIPPSSNVVKEEKGRYRSSQRYSSDDLYKPRPLFSSSSRRSRRSNQA